MRRMAAVCAACMLLALTGCTSDVKMEPPVYQSAVPAERESSDGQLAQSVLISFINSVDRKDLDNFFRFSDMGFLCEASGGNTEELKAGMEKEDWAVLYDTGLVDNVKQGICVTGIQDVLSVLKDSTIYPDIDLSRITGAYRFDFDETNETYVLCIDGEWKVDIALVNVAEMVRNEKENNS